MSIYKPPAIFYKNIEEKYIKIGKTQIDNLTHTHLHQHTHTHSQYIEYMFALMIKTLKTHKYIETRRHGFRKNKTKITASIKFKQKQWTK